MFERALRAWTLAALIVGTGCSGSVEKGSGGRIARRNGLGEPAAGG